MLLNILPGASTHVFTQSCLSAHTVDIYLLFMQQGPGDAFYLKSLKQCCSDRMDVYCACSWHGKKMFGNVHSTVRVGGFVHKSLLCVIN